MKTMNDLLKRFTQVNPALIIFMLTATHINGDKYDLDYQNPENWNYLRDLAKKDFTIKEISALDGSALIHEIV